MALKDTALSKESIDELIELIERKNASPIDRCFVYRHLVDIGQHNRSEKYAISMLREHGLNDWSLWKLLTDSIDVSQNLDMLNNLIIEISDKSDKRAILLAKLFVANASCQIDMIKDVLTSYLKAFPTGNFQSVDVKVIFQDTPETIKNEIASFCRISAGESAESRVTWLLCADVLNQKIQMSSTEEQQACNCLYDIVKLASNANEESIVKAREMLNKESGLPNDVTPYSFVLIQMIISLILGIVTVTVFPNRSLL
jgi:hypothetical protein